MPKKPSKGCEMCATCCTPFGAEKNAVCSKPQLGSVPGHEPTLNLIQTAVKRKLKTLAAKKKQAQPMSKRNILAVKSSSSSAKPACCAPQNGTGEELEGLIS